MDKKITTRVGLGVAVLLVLLLVSYFSNTNTKEIVVSSDDGLINIYIPNDAMPFGLEAESIKIEKEDVPENESLLIAYYRLEPEGTTFEKPIRITYEATTKGEEGLPLLLHDHDEQFTILEEVTVENTQKENTSRLSTYISGFSGLAVTISPFAIYSEVSGSTVIGNPFSLNINIYRHFTELGEDTRVRLMDRRIPYLGDLVSDEWGTEQWSVTLEGDSHVITPNAIEYPANPVQPRDKSIKIRETLTCLDEGNLNVKRNNVRVLATFMSKQELPKMSKYKLPEGGPDGTFLYDYPIPLRSHNLGFFCKKQKPGEMIEIEPPQLILQAGSAPLGQNESRTGFVNDQGVRMYNGKPVQNDSIEPVR